MPPKTVAEHLPPLPPVSVDFDALQKALRDGKSGDDAVDIATGEFWPPKRDQVGEDAEPVPVAPIPADAPADPSE